MSMPCLLVLSLLGATAGPLSLDDALALAAKRNPDVELARADEAAAASDYRLSWQGVLPRLDLSFGFGHQWQGTQDQVQVVPNPAGTEPPFVRTIVSYPANDFGVYQLGLALNWTLFDGLASWYRISSARSRSSSARSDTAETALRLAFEVTRRFYGLVREQETMRVRRDTAALSAELVKRADALFAAGRATRADTYSTRVNLANDELAVKSQAAVLARARADLAQVLAVPADDALEVVPPAALATPRVPVVRTPPPLATLQSTAAERRPLLVSRRQALDAAEDDVARARGAWSPVLAFQTTYQKSGPDLTGSTGIFGDPGKQYFLTVQGTVSWNIFGGGETVEGVRRAGAQASRAVALLRSAEAQVSAEIATAREQVVTLAESVAVSQEALDAADKTLRFERELLDAGRATQLEVRDAALKLAQARLAAFGTLVDLAVADADLNRAVGGGP